MGEINITSGEEVALNSIEYSELKRLVDQVCLEQDPHILNHLPLSECGPFVSDEFRCFLEKLKTRRPSDSRILSEGQNLLSAFRQMKDRLERELRERDFFYIEDKIPEPFFLSNMLSVTIFFKWRKSKDDNWTHGDITVNHKYEEPINHFVIKKRNVSLAKAREQQRKLFDVWDHLRKLALYAVRDYFRARRDGTLIPKTFSATVDSYSRALNNYSVKF